jgi:amidohydrolase
MLANSLSSRIEAVVAAIEPELVAIRRDIHAHPEVGFEEVRTAGIVANRLAALGLPARTGMGRTGVLAHLDTGRPGRHLLIRADMDALPIHEQTGLAFASTVEGKMHACGHDLHVATLLGVAEVMERLKDQLSGRVSFMFQPAEETSDSGAAAMIAEGALDGVDMALGFHNHPDEAVGTFSYTPGISNGSSDEFSILVTGKSGHAARPHHTCDPIVAAATLILQLQTIVSREVDPMHPAVLTIGGIEGGLANNIIPDSCRLIGTVRTQHPENRDLIEQAILRICAGVSDSLRVDCRLDMVRGVPSMVSDETVMMATVRSIADHYGDVVHSRPASLGAEDFALIGAKVPAFQLGVGSQTPGRDDRLHNSDYQPDERCIGYGVVGLALAAFDLLQCPT